MALEGDFRLLMCQSHVSVAITLVFEQLVAVIAREQLSLGVHLKGWRNELRKS